MHERTNLSFLFTCTQFARSQGSCQLLTPAINDAVVQEVLLGSGLRSVIASDFSINMTLAGVQSLTGLDYDGMASNVDMVGTYFEYIFFCLCLCQSL